MNDYKAYRDKITHLSEEEIKELARRYYAGEKNALLIKEYNIDIHVNHLYKSFPLVENEHLCPYCYIPMKMLPKSKNAYRHNDPFCGQCGHQVNRMVCNCTGCIKASYSKEQARLRSEALEKERRHNVVKKLQHDAPKLEELSIQDKLYTGALLLECLTENMQKIIPLSQASGNIAPTIEYEVNILSDLCKKRIIIPHPDSVSFVSINDNGSLTVNVRATAFLLNISSCNKSFPEIIESLLYPKALDQDDMEEGYRLWKEVALHEGIEYLSSRLKDYQLPLNIGDKTRLVMVKVLDDYAVSQLFNFIWSAVKNAAAFKQKQGIGYRHAANTIPGNIVKRYEYAQAEKWNIKGYNRDFNCQQSTISLLLNNRLLNIGEAGFKKHIDMNFLIKDRFVDKSETIHDRTEES